MDSRTRSAHKIVSSSEATAHLELPVVLEVPQQAHSSSHGLSPARPISKRREEMLQKMNSIKRTNTNSSGSPSTRTTTCNTPTDEVTATTDTSNSASDGSASKILTAAVRRSVSQRSIEKLRRSTSAPQSRSSDVTIDSTDPLPTEPSSIDHPLVLAPVPYVSALPARRTMQRANSGRQLKAKSTTLVTLSDAASATVPSGSLEKVESPALQRYKGAIRPENPKGRLAVQETATGTRFHPPTPERKLGGRSNPDNLENEASRLSKPGSQASAPKPEIRHKQNTLVPVALDSTLPPNVVGSGVDLARDGMEARSGRRSRYQAASKTVAASRLHSVVSVDNTGNTLSTLEQKPVLTYSSPVINPIKAEMDLKSGKRAFVALQQKRSMSVPKLRPLLEESSTMATVSDSQSTPQGTGIKAATTSVTSLPSAKSTMEMKRAKLVKARLLVKDASYASPTPPVHASVSTAVSIVVSPPERTAADRAKVNRGRNFLKEFPPTETTKTQLSEAPVSVSVASWTEKRTRAMQLVGGRRSLGSSSLSFTSDTSSEAMTVEQLRLVQSKHISDAGTIKMKEQSSFQAGASVSSPSPERWSQKTASNKMEDDEKQTVGKLSLKTSISQKKVAAREIIKRRAARTSLEFAQTNSPTPSESNAEVKSESADLSQDQIVQVENACDNKIPTVNLESREILVDRNFLPVEVDNRELLFTPEAMHDSELDVIESRKKESVDKTATLRAYSPEIPDDEIVDADQFPGDVNAEAVLNAMSESESIATVLRNHGEAFVECSEKLAGSVPLTNTLFDDTGQCITALSMDDEYALISKGGSPTFADETVDASDKVTLFRAVVASDLRTEIPSEASQDANSLDFSSIISNSVESSAVVERSWDTMKVMFSEFEKLEKKPNDDHFKCMLSDLEGAEKKHSNASIQKVHPAIEEGVLDPLGWPRQEVGHFHETLLEPSEEKAPVEADVDDSADLLVRIEDEETPSSTVLSPSKDVRILSYETKLSGALSSDESSDGLQSEEDDSDEKDVAFGYVSQDSDDEEEHDQAPLLRFGTAMPDVTLLHSSETFQPFVSPTEPIRSVAADISQLTNVEDTTMPEVAQLDSSETFQPFISPTEPISFAAADSSQSTHVEDTTMLDVAQVDLFETFQPLLRPTESIRSAEADITQSTNVEYTTRLDVAQLDSSEIFQLLVSPTEPVRPVVAGIAQSTNVEDTTRPDVALLDSSETFRPFVSPTEPVRSLAADLTQSTNVADATIRDVTQLDSSETFQPFLRPTEPVCPVAADIAQSTILEDSKTMLPSTSTTFFAVASPSNSSTNTFVGSDTFISTEASAIGIIPPPPPPPPPPGQKKARRQSRRTKENVREAVPLLPPPPEAKLKLWEESKTATNSHHSINDRITGSPVIVETRNAETAHQDASNEGSEQRQEATCVIDPSNDPEILRKAFSDLSVSPASTPLILRDTTLAELDNAIVDASNTSGKQPTTPNSEYENRTTTIAEITESGLSPSTLVDHQLKTFVAEQVNSVCMDVGFEVANREQTFIDSNRYGDEASKVFSRRSIVPKVGPSAFTLAIVAEPAIIAKILDCLGDPVAVCRMKMVNKTCFQYIDANEHCLMRDAVRLGGMNMNVRPYFWLWVTLNLRSSTICDGSGIAKGTELTVLERQGREGKWHHIIQRDVSRAFGTLPPHKTGARLRTDSIVRALITWGKSRVMRRGVKGTKEGTIRSNESSESDDISLSPTDTVSDWGGVTPVGSFSGSFTSSNSGQAQSEEAKARRAVNKKAEQKRVEELALSGNTLTDEVKASLQQKLSFILHALAASHPDVGYCQGMDYLVAHLLRILQDTIRWKAVNGTMPTSILSTPIFTSKLPPNAAGQALTDLYAEIDQSLVVEETCFRVMDSFFTVYNLQHFYWPELRCLKTCCRVFEKIIQIKLPVLADHFEHHELNVGLFALGWFQTLFLYLPSMPSATVNHMWDIWLVERSFKIFFRVGTAILFLSQPILLNHELEGMMSYLNTFPDATLLSPDILIACALQIKITNRMLMDLEREVKESTMTC